MESRAGWSWHGPGTAQPLAGHPEPPASRLLSSRDLGDYPGVGAGLSPVLVPIKPVGREKELPAFQILRLEFPVRKAQE